MKSLYIVVCSPERGQSFIDVLDAQWECEGELVPLDPSVLNPREFLVYQHGLFLMHTLLNLKLVGAAYFQPHCIFFLCFFLFIHLKRPSSYFFK